MTRIHTTLAAACAVFSLSAALPARAQDAAAETREVLDSLPGLIAEMTDKLRPLAESVGVDISDLIGEMEPMMRAVFPTPPEGEANWAYSFGFENKNSVTDSGSATEGRQTVLADAQACAALYPRGGPVVHFRRIHRDGLTGHQCVMRTYDGSAAVLLSETYAEGADRHMSANYAAAVSVEGDAEAARALFEPVLDANISLAVELADLAVEATVRAIPGGADAGTD